VQSVNGRMLINGNQEKERERERVGYLNSETHWPIAKERIRSGVEPMIVFARVA